MLNRLIKLYSKSNSSTPLEDFTTEVFASILENDEEIRKKFTSEILGLSCDDFKIETQKNYSLDMGERAVIDIVLRGKEVIVFIENKVESSEGVNQLEKYSRVLDGLTGYTEKCLFYCTKYYDPKENRRPNFKQYRWYDVAKIMASSDDYLAREFYSFLKSNNMTQKDSITTRELFALENIKETMDFLDSFLERIQPNFKELFGKFSSPDNTSQMRKYNRYVFYKPNVLGSEKAEKWSEIGVGFKFDQTPQAFVWIWIQNGHPQLARFNEYLSEHKDLFDLHDSNSLSFSADLMSFMGKKESLVELQNWYQEKFRVLKGFMDQTKDLGWKFD
jgi:hypothetical protein